jgi:hypothetical protein
VAETIEATIDKVEQDIDTGWFTVVTDQGKFSTKIREKADEAVGLRGSRVLLRYSEQVKTKDGRTYRNRYYEDASEVPSANGGFTETSSRKTPKEDAWRMSLSVGAKCAVDTLPLMPSEQRTFDTQKQVALAWAKFLFFTPMPEMPTAQLRVVEPTREPVVYGAYTEPEAPPPHGDDDIPY